MIGEGEHKLIRYLEQKEKKRVCIFSPDADLIMLAIGLAKKNVYILRPNIYTHVKCTHFMVSIDTFRKQVVALIDPEHKFPEKEQQIVDDFVFLLFFMGNDFLPHSPTFEIKHKGIDKILEIYKNIFQQGACLVQTRPTYAISTNGFRMVLSALSGVELFMLEQKKKNHRGFPNQLLDKYGGRLSTEFESYRKEYYQLHFPNSTSKDVCREYVVGLLFVGAYYYQGMPDWLYNYPFYHGPFFHELYNYCVNELNSDWITMQFEKHEPLTPLVQLMCVIPPESKRWLPECIQPYYEGSSEIIDMYPSEFKVDLDGVQNEYEGLVMLPPIEVKRVQEAFDKVKHQLTYSEKKRNIHVV